MREPYRKLTAVIVADVHGYTRLMELDDENTRLVLNIHRTRFKDLATAFGGRVIDTSGDSIFAEFPSAQRAVECAVDFQRTVNAFNCDLKSNQRMRFRLGINVGDVLDDGLSIYGEVVNATSRIQALAVPGGICVSSIVKDLTAGHTPFRFSAVEDRSVKSKNQSLHIFRVQMASQVQMHQLTGSLSLKVSSGESLGIAVFPLTCLNAFSDSQHLGWGISEDIIAGLSRFRSIDVIALETTFCYREDEDPVTTARNELNVQYVVQGTLDACGSQVQLNVKLVDCTSKKRIWGERYILDPDEVYSVSLEIVNVIAGVLEARLQRYRNRSAKKLNAYKYRAYDYWLKGHRMLGQAPPVCLRSIEDHFKTAIELDPECTRAYTSLALIGYRQAIVLADGAQWETGIRKATEWCRHAITLDASDCRAHLGFAYGCLLSQEFDRAKVHYDIAGDLSPNSSDILISRARAHSLMGEVNRGLDLATRAQRLNPVHPQYYQEYLSLILFLDQRFDDCVHTLNRNAPKSPEYKAIKAAAEGQLGAGDAAQKSMGDFLSSMKKIWGRSPANHRNQCLKWLIRVFPFKSSRDRDRVVKALKKVGLDGYAGDDGYYPKI